MRIPVVRAMVIRQHVPLTLDSSFHQLNAQLVKILLMPAFQVCATSRDMFLQTHLAQDHHRIVYRSFHVI
jgi:hypothetical protein